MTQTAEMWGEKGVARHEWKEMYEGGRRVDRNLSIFKKNDVKDSKLRCGR